MVQIFAADFGIRPYFTVLKSHSYDHYYADLELAEVSGYLAILIVKAPIASKPGPSNASYTVQQAIEPTIVLQGVSQDTEQQFKMAIKALRLEAPHTQITVKDDDAAYICHDHSSCEEEDVSLGGHNGDAEEGNEGGDKVELGRYGALDCHWRCATLKKHCLDCGRDICQGRYEAQRPSLMMLGSGELEAYSIE